MTKRSSPLVALSAASVLALTSAGAVAQDDEKSTPELAPYSPLGLQGRPAPSKRNTLEPNALRLGLGYTSDDNYKFGEYNGLSQQGPTAIVDVQWQDFHRSDNYWQMSLSDMGLDTREGKAVWGRADRIRITLGFDSQQQVRNDSGQTPFRGNVSQSLPDGWVSGQNTADFTTLDGALRDFDRVLTRDKAYMGINATLNEQWSVSSNLSYEHKEGHGDAGAGIYIDGASADSVLLRTPVDYGTTEFDIGVAYSADRLHLNGQLAYSRFDNDNDLLVWENPYSSYGADVRYPSGIGGLGLAPDNDQTSARLTGSYIVSPRVRVQFDGSYAVASQDQNYAPYTVNEALLVTVPEPRSDFSGEVATGTSNIRLLWNPLPKLNTKVFYKLRDRDYDINRDAYLYVRGDGGNQPDSLMTVYNTDHDLTSQTAGAEASYRLPLRSRLTVEYAYEEVKRRNAPVEKTEEDRYTLGYRIQPWSNFTTRLKLEYGDRAASEYQWAQDYYALLDTELINATPDSQRYTTHPLLMKYYMANRERWQSSADFSFLPTTRWNLNLNLMWRDDNYNASELGLTQTQWYRTQLSVSYAMSDTLSASAYTGYDRYETDQSSRAFRGGAEKDAFEIYPPLPQASDPEQDWHSDSTDNSITVGATLQWQVAPELTLSLDYSYVDTTSEQNISTQSSATVTASDLPNVNSTLHQLRASSIWQVHDDISVQLDYQFYSYNTDDWAWDDVQTDTIGKVLTFGQTNPNEDIHYVGASVVYSWQ